jgi:hypothetical protein
MTRNESTDRAELESVSLFALAPLFETFSKRSKFFVFILQIQELSQGEGEGGTNLFGRALGPKCKR